MNKLKFLLLAIVPLCLFAEADVEVLKDSADLISEFYGELSQSEKKEIENVDVFKNYCSKFDVALAGSGSDDGYGEESFTNQY